MKHLQFNFTMVIIPLKQKNESIGKLCQFYAKNEWHNQVLTVYRRVYLIISLFFKCIFSRLLEENPIDFMRISYSKLELYKCKSCF